MRAFLLNKNKKDQEEYFEKKWIKKYKESNKLVFLNLMNLHDYGKPLIAVIEFTNDDVPIPYENKKIFKLNNFFVNAFEDITPDRTEDVYIHNPLTQIAEIEVVNIPGKKIKFNIKTEQIGDKSEPEVVYYVPSTNPSGEKSYNEINTKFFSVTYNQTETDSSYIFQRTLKLNPAHIQKNKWPKRLSIAQSYTVFYKIRALLLSERFMRKSNKFIWEILFCSGFVLLLYNMTFAQEEIEQGFATIELITEPENAQVFINGENRGSTPHIIEKLTPGEYKISLKLSGFEDFNETISLSSGGKKKFVVQLMNIYGGLLIFCEPESASVNLNGIFIGKAPINCDTLKPGTYEVELSLPNYSSKKINANVEKGRKDTIFIALDPLWKQLFGSLSISSTPNGATIILA